MKPGLYSSQIGDAKVIDFKSTNPIAAHTKEAWNLLYSIDKQLKFFSTFKKNRSTSPSHTKTQSIGPKLLFVFQFNTKENRAYESKT